MSWKWLPRLERMVVRVLTLSSSKGLLGTSFAWIRCMRWNISSQQRISNPKNSPPPPTSWTFLELNASTSRFYVLFGDSHTFWLPLQSFYHLFQFNPTQIKYSKILSSFSQDFWSQTCVKVCWFNIVLGSFLAFISVFSLAINCLTLPFRNSSVSHLIFQPQLVIKYRGAWSIIRRRGKLPTRAVASSRYAGRFFWKVHFSGKNSLAVSNLSQKTPFLIFKSCKTLEPNCYMKNNFSYFNSMPNILPYLDKLLKIIP